VQMMPTSAVGTVVTSSAGSVTLDLSSLDGRLPTMFNFAGTGTTSAQDANPASYLVMLPATLSGSGLNTTQPVQVVGYVSAFGSAPPDFSAMTLVNYAQTPAVLAVHWASPGASAPFMTLSATQLVISQATLKSSAFDVIRVGPVTIDPSTLSSGLEFVPDATAAMPQFAIGHAKSHTVNAYASFADLSAALATEFSGSVGAEQVLASGQYDSSTGVLSASGIIVVADD
jgi:hypothetical protein